MVCTKHQLAVLSSEFRNYWNLGRIAPPRSMLQFAEDEVIIPTGIYAGRKYSVDRQPFNRLWFEAVDSGKWIEYAATGPSQSGKSLVCYVIPILYHLFESCETVIAAAPVDKINENKWELDILPVLRRTRYYDLLPSRGGGSRGGYSDMINFTNGASLKFMSGGGSDKARAYFTSRVVVITETDGMDHSSEASDESNKIEQIEARTRAYSGRRRVYKECTVSTEGGHIWQRYIYGTRSSVILPCQYCGDYVTLERQHLRGWQEAANDVDAMEGAYFACPACGVAWSDSDWRTSNAGCKLLHHGQAIEAGEVTGDAPRTRTFSFRWSAGNNLMMSPADFAEDEYKAKSAIKPEEAEKKLCQFVWANPWIPPEIKQYQLDEYRVRSRQSLYPRNKIPDGTYCFTVGIDIGFRLGHYVTMCSVPHDENDFGSTIANAYVIDYGIFEIPSDNLGLEDAIRVSLQNFRDNLRNMYERSPNQVWVDSRYGTNSVLKTVAQFNEIDNHPIGAEVWRGYMGFGTGQIKSKYHAPNKDGDLVRYVGDEFHIIWSETKESYIVQVNSDEWKTRVHGRVNATSADSRRIYLFNVPHTNDHIPISKHWTAEHVEERFVQGKGVQNVWVRDRKANHYLDATYAALAAAELCLELRMVPEVVEDSSPGLAALVARENDYGT